MMSWVRIWPWIPEKRTGRCIPDEVLDVKPYHELTVGELTNMLYDYLKDYGKR